MPKCSLKMYEIFKIIEMTPNKTKIARTLNKIETCSTKQDPPPKKHQITKNKKNSNEEINKCINNMQL